MNTDVIATCALCGKTSSVFGHEYRVGNLPGPPTWVVSGPMYFAASADRKSVARPYCSPTCATQEMAASQ